MIETDELTTRHAIPRWQSLRLSINNGEQSGAHQRRVPPMRHLAAEHGAKSLAKDFELKKAAWQESGDVVYAEELLSTALVSGNESDPEVMTAAIRVAANAETQPGMSRFAHEIVHGIEEGQGSALPVREAEVRVELARRKMLLRLNPRDGVRLAETALLYANLGQTHKSEELLLRALQTYPNNRYVLRSAARFFSHIHAPDTAAEILRRSPRTVQDPWLSAALLAVESEASLELTTWRSANSLVRNDSFSNLDKSELAAQLGSLESVNGSRKKTVRLIELSLLDPTENAVAQLEWLGRQSAAFENTGLRKQLTASHEAVANRAFWNEDFTGSVDACDSWQAIEPFSSRPAIFGTYVASVTSSSIEQAIGLAEAALLSNPADSTLWNNLAVLRVYRGEMELALEALAKSVGFADQRDRSTVSKATKGLIQIRSGDIDGGIASYLSAIETALGNKDATTAIRAYSFMGREMSKVDNTLRLEVLEQLDGALKAFQKAGVSIPKDVQLLRQEIEATDTVTAQGISNRELALDLPDGLFQ